MQGQADSLQHMPDSSVTILTGLPVMWREGDELSGDRIEIKYIGRKVDRTFVFGNAEAVSEAKKNDIRVNRMTGDTLIISTVNDSTRNVRVKGSAKGWYHVWNEEDVYQGVNQSAADVIEFTIVSNHATNLHLEGRANGTFYPPDLVPMDNPVSMKKPKRG
jgi:hypothetical protein